MPVLDRSSVLGLDNGELASVSRGNYSPSATYAQSTMERVALTNQPKVSQAITFRVEFRSHGLVFIVQDYSPEGAFRQACQKAGIVATKIEAEISY
jgi:hypothetical protein